MNHFEKVKDYLRELDYDIVHEDEDEQLVVVDKEDHGIKNLVIDCEDPILVIEQHLFDLKNDSLDVYKQLLVKNREIVHGAFVMDESGRKVLFRDTLQLENLDLNELEGSLNSLALLLSEYYNELIEFSKN
ncbi:YbjN domain-containing protein [Rapidithrix thailandica]|uniref:YbjN domain-containing protein n=1 Tax=Rapidithrix thailandica TaxID=413964 RepID=A0AAW9RZ16_9BACT